MKTNLIKYPLFLFAIVSLWSCFSESKLDKYIQNRDYDKAYAYATKYDNNFFVGGGLKRKVATAQVPELIQSGEYVIARQIAEDYGMNFQNLLMNSLPLIYEKKGARELMLAITRIERPSQTSIDAVKEYNKQVEVIAKMMVVNGEDDYLEKLLDTLVPLSRYKEKENPKKGFFEPDMVRVKDKNGQDIIITDYAEVNRIREGFGLKPIKSK